MILFETDIVIKITVYMIYIMQALTKINFLLRYIIPIMLL